MAEKEKQSEHKSTIDKYFSRTADGFKAWAEEAEVERNYLQVAAETTGDTDEKETKDSIFILPTTARPISSQAELLKQWKGMKTFVRLSLQQRKCIILQTSK